MGFTYGGGVEVFSPIPIPTPFASATNTQPCHVLRMLRNDVVGKEKKSILRPFGGIRRMGERGEDRGWEGYWGKGAEKRSS